MLSRSPVIAIILLAGLATPQSIYAGDDAPDNSVKYRHKSMEALGKRMSMVNMIVKGEMSREKDLAGHARAMNDIAKTLPELWPKGSLKDSESKKEIWDKWDDFLAECKSFEEATAAMLVATEGHDLTATKAAYETVGNACGSCHDKYRVEEEDEK